VTIDPEAYRPDMARPRADVCVRRLRAVCAGLPEVEERTGGEGGRHIAFVVRKRTFGYFTDDHHGDGRLALLVKAPKDEQGALVASDADRYFVPPYLGHRGWVGFRLDVGTVDWDEARELLVESYCLSAPKKLAAAVTP
jgi:hypothetical protein